MKREVVRVFEHQKLTVGDPAVFSDTCFAALVRLNERNGNKYYTVGNKRIWFKSFVGVIQVGNLTIEVLPKADSYSGSNTEQKWQRALLKMLHVTNRVRVESVSDAFLRLRNSSLMDIYIETFVTQVERLISEGLVRKYRFAESNLPFVKGRIVFNRHLTMNLLHRERFYTSHQVYDANNLFNGILKQALLILLHNLSRNSLTQRLNDLLVHFECISEYFPNDEWFDNIVYDRKTERYRNAMIIARMILHDYTPDIKGGTDNVVAILFDMNKLFQEYICYALRSAARKTTTMSIEITSQHTKSFWQNATIRPDIVLKVITGSQSMVYVIDTKWKVLSSQRPGDDDLKQMFVYNLYYTSPHSILFLPAAGLSNEGKKEYACLPCSEIPRQSCELYFANLFDEHDELDEKFAIKFMNDRILNHCEESIA